MAKPSSPKPPPPSRSPSPSPVTTKKKPQPISWTHQETVNLVKAYQEQWYLARRGQLRANQWEHVAVTVAACCGFDSDHPSKSALQCRHKMEKLRQRYRAVKGRLADSGVPTNMGNYSWQYFALMEELDHGLHGPLPIAAKPLASLMPSDNGDEEEEEKDDDSVEEDDDDDDERDNYIHSKRPRITKYGKKSKGFRMMSSDDDGGGGGGMVVNEMGLVSGLTAEIKAFAERFVGLENWKMKMIRETERFRLEMENKRIEMILESQQRIVDSIGRAFGSSTVEVQPRG